MLYLYLHSEPKLGHRTSEHLKYLTLKDFSLKGTQNIFFNYINVKEYEVSK